MISCRECVHFFAKFSGTQVRPLNFSFRFILFLCSFFMASILKVTSLVQAALAPFMWRQMDMSFIVLEGTVPLLYHVRDPMQWGDLIIQGDLQSMPHMVYVFSFS